MRQTVKRDIHAAVEAAVKSVSTELPLKKVNQGRWRLVTGPRLAVEVDVLLETDHGEGMFRIGWGVRAAGAAAVLDVEDLPGTGNATVGGDLGSLARRVPGMTMLCVKGGDAGALTRLWWGSRPQKPEELSDKVRGWLVDYLPVLARLRSYADLAGFVETFDVRYGKANVHPETPIGRLQTAIALRALQGDSAAVEESIARWTAMTGGPAKDPFLHDLDDRFLARVRSTLANSKE